LQSRGYRQTVTIGSDSVTQTNPFVCQSQNAFIVVGLTKTTTQLVKVHTRWTPDSNGSSVRSPAVTRALARRALSGMTVDLYTAWNMIPWSWLVDWCSTASDYFQATRNIVGATLSDVSVMRHTRTDSSSPDYTDGSLSMTGIRMLYETKTRARSFIAPTAQFPFLSGRQMGIVASIGVTRR
jgi:hypothetical protein